MINPGDAAKLADQIDAANAAGYRLDALRLNSPGGDVWEAFQIAIMVRSVTGMATAVDKRSVCLSACFGVFAGGWRRNVDPAPNQIGVHSTSISNQETPEATAKTTFHARKLSAIGVPDKIIAKIVLTPPGQMYFLTLNDLWAMSVNVPGMARPPGAGPARPPPLDPDPLYIARVVQNIDLNDGTTIPSGSLVVILDQCKHIEARVRRCFINYGAFGSQGATVIVSSLRLIKQGW